MTDQLRQAAQMALEALEHHSAIKHPQQIHYRDTAIAALKAALEQQAEPPPEWPLIKNILAVFGLDAISFVAAWKAAQQAEPTCPECKAAVLYECAACSSNNYPPQRQWVGLTDEEILSTDPWEILRADPWMGTSDSNINPYQILLKVRTLEAKLKERNA